MTRSKLISKINPANLHELEKILQSDNPIFETVSEDLDIEDLRSRFREASQFSTLILEQYYIDHTHPENAPFFLTEYKRELSQVKREAFRLMQARDKNIFDAVEEIINQFFGKDAMDSKEWYEEYEHYLECLVQSFFPDALENLSYLWAFEKFSGKEEDFDEAIFKLISDRYNKELLNYRKQVFLPTYERKYYLKYDLILPSPLGIYNHACCIKQFYLIRIGASLHIASGCSCNAANSYQHGLYGHYFASLETEGKKITSFITEIDKKCNFLVKKNASHFIVHAEGLQEAYQISKKQSDELTKNIEKYFSQLLI